MSAVQRVTGVMNEIEASALEQSDGIEQVNKAVMQMDGNLVVYDAGGGAAFDSKTEGHPGSYLAVQDNGSVVIYDGATALWTKP